MSQQDHAVGATKNTATRLASLATIGFVVTASAKFTNGVIPFFTNFYTANPNIKGVIDWLVGLCAVIATLSWGYRGWLLIQPTLKLIYEAGLEWASKKAAKTSITIIKPAELSDFSDCFRGVKTIQAYNPPLNLLKRRKPHRDIIAGDTWSEDFRYEMIVSNDGARRLCDIAKLWKTEGVPDVALNRVSVICYDHNANLHTEIANWGILGADLRGLSFFLIEHRDLKRMALLYPLGKPFVETFDVPHDAIRIVGPEGGNEIYSNLQETFTKRWHELDGNDDPRYDVRPLTSFVEFFAQNQR